MEIEAKDLVTIARRVVTQTGISIRDLRIVSYQKVSNIWRVNISYRVEGAGTWWTKSAALAIDATTGEATQFWEGRVWK